MNCFDSLEWLQPWLLSTLDAISRKWLPVHLQQRTILLLKMFRFVCFLISRAQKAPSLEDSTSQSWTSLSLPTILLWLLPVFFTFSLLIPLVNPYHFVTFRKRYALFWGLGACVGMSSWFFILVNILKSYRKTLKIISVVWFLNNLGTFLIFVGIFSLFSIMWTLV